MQIGYLDDHTEAIPTLARWYHDQWGFITPGLTLDDRYGGYPVTIMDRDLSGA